MWMIKESPRDIHFLPMIYVLAQILVIHSFAVLPDLSSLVKKAGVFGNGNFSPLLEQLRGLSNRYFSPGSYAALRSQYPASHFLSQFLHMPYSELCSWITASHGCMVDTCSELHLTHTPTGQLDQNTALVETCFFSFPPDSLQKTSDRLTCEGRKGTYERKHSFFPAVLPGTIHIFFHEGLLFT